MSSGNAMDEAGRRRLSSCQLDSQPLPHGKYRVQFMRDPGACRCSCCRWRPSLQWTHYNSALSSYLRQKVEEELGAVKAKSHLFDACFNQSVGGYCRGDHKRPVEHALDPAWYNRRVQFHLRQIDILNDLQLVPGSDDFWTRMRQRK